jgi:hypothetical protein
MFDRAREKLKAVATKSVVETNWGYRTAIGVIGAGLPFLILVISSILGKKFLTSISAYYHARPAGDWFVGTLFVIGVFLMFDRYTPSEKDPRAEPHAGYAALGKLAGSLAARGRNVPHDGQKCHVYFTASNHRVHPRRGRSEPLHLSGNVPPATV